MVRCKEHNDQKHPYINICDMNEFGQAYTLYAGVESRSLTIAISLTCRPRSKSTARPTNKSKTLNHTHFSAKPSASTTFSFGIILHRLRSMGTPSLRRVSPPPLRTPPQQALLPGARSARPLTPRSCTLSVLSLCVIGVGLTGSFRRIGSLLSF